MIFDSLANAETYRAMPDVYRALLLLRQYGGARPADGSATEDGRIRLSSLHIQTKPECDCRYEAHRNWIDIHYTVCGTEVILVQDVGSLRALSPFDPQADIGFYEGTAQVVCRVSPGMFLVCFPEDAHKVCVCDGAPSGVQKLVVKIKAGG